MSRTPTPDIWQYRLAKWVIYVSVFLAPLNAMIAHWYPFTTPKTLLIIGGTIIASTLFLWGLLLDPRESVRTTYLHYILGAFLVVMALAAALGINPHQSFFGTFFSSSSVVLLIALGTLAWMIAEFVRRDRVFIKKIATTVFISGVVTACITYFPYINSSWKVLALSGGSGLVGNSSFTGGFLIFTIGLGVYALMVARPWRGKIGYLVGIGVMALCPLFINAHLWHGSAVLSETHSPFVFLGQAQGAILGLAISVVGFFSLLLLTGKKKVSKIIGGVIGAVLLTGIIIGYHGLFSPDSVIHQKFVEAKTGTRLVYWDIAKKAIKERPVLGWGFENYQTVYQSKFDPTVYSQGYAYEQWVTNPHNVLFDMGVSGGILGLGAYLILLVTAGWVAFKKAWGDPTQRALIVIPAILLGYLVQNFFIFDTPTTWLVYFVVIGVALGVVSKGTEITLDTPFKKGIGALKMVALAVAFIVFVILPAHESRQWAKAIALPISPERIALQERVQHISPMGSVDDDIVYAQKTFEVLADIRTDLKPEEKTVYLDEIDSLVAILARDATRYPQSFYVRYLAGSFTHLAYITDPTRGVAALDAAKGYFDQARMISPANPKVYYNLAQNALFRKDTQTAIALVKQGMALGSLGEGEALLKRIQK